MSNEKPPNDNLAKLFDAPGVNWAVNVLRDKGIDGPMYDKLLEADAHYRQIALEILDEQTP
jgi:hypothetical protein